MSKIETGKMSIVRERFDFSEVTQDLNTIIFPQMLERSLRFEEHVHEPLDRFYVGDALRLKQILMNLLSNAMKFTHPGGSIVVDIAEGHRQNGFASLRFCVSDTGIGMSEAFMERIFQPFEQETSERARNNVGSGLGPVSYTHLVELRVEKLLRRDAEIIADAEEDGHGRIVDAGFDVIDVACALTEG